MKIKVWDEFIRKLPIEAKVVECFQKCFVSVFFHSVPILVEPLIYLFHALVA